MDIRSQLKQAYQLIKEDRKAEAYDLLVPILELTPDNVDAWWLAANAAPTPDLAVYACQKVLHFKPDHAPAQQLLLKSKQAIELAKLNITDTIKAVKPAPRRISSAWLIAGIALLSIIGGSLLFVSYLSGVNFQALIDRIKPTDGSITINKSGTSVPTAPPNGMKQPVSLNSSGTTLTGSVAVGASNDYIFVAHSGDTLFVTVKFVTLDGNSSKSLILLGPDGQPMTTFLQNMTGGRASLNAALSQDGTYTLRIHGQEGVAQGAYVLGMGLDSQ